MYIFRGRKQKVRNCKFIVNFFNRKHPTASAQVEPKPYQWVSTGTLATSDAQHYGLKVLIEDQNETGSTANNGYIRFLVRSWFGVKHGQ